MQNIIPLQIFVEEGLKLTILLFAINQKCSCYCCSSLQLMDLFTAFFLSKNAVFKSSFFAVKTYVTFCSCFHFFQIDREMSTIKLMTVTLE